MKAPGKKPPRLFSLEADFEEWVRAELKKIPSSYWIPKNNTFYKRGLPDIIGTIAGFFVAIELKAEGAATDSSRELLQEYEVYKMKQAGVIVAYPRVYPSNWLQLEEELYGLVDDPAKRSRH